MNYRNGEHEEMLYLVKFKKISTTRDLFFRVENSTKNINVLVPL